MKPAALPVTEAGLGDRRPDARLDLHDQHALVPDEDQIQLAARNPEVPPKKLEALFLEQGEDQVLPLSSYLMRSGPEELSGRRSSSLSPSFRGPRHRPAPG